MSTLREQFVKLIDGFAAIPTTASASTTVRNPINKNVESLLKNPQYKKLGNFEYIKFGGGDDIDEILEILKSKSSTHSGIINRKAKMVAGNELVATGATGNDWDAFIKAAGGAYNATLEKEWMKACNLYETYGAVGFLRQLDGSKIVKFKALSPRQLRISKLGSKGEITDFIYRMSFSNGAGALFKGTERKIPVFDPVNKKNQKESIIYVSNPATDNDYYGLPNYVGAFDFIEADYQFGRTIHNAAENGFQPKVSATFIGRNMTDEQKKEHADKFKSNFQQSDGELAIVNYVRTKEEMPVIDKLDINNLDKTISVMANLNDAKILTAHSVTNPALFGVAIAGKLGNSGTELESSYNIFRTTETLPNRKLLIDAMTSAFVDTNFKNVKFEVTDISVTPQENRGDNVAPADKKVDAKTGKDAAEDKTAAK